MPNSGPRDHPDVEILDLPSSETRSLSGAIVDLLGRLWSRLPCMRVTMQPSSDQLDEDDECEFDIRFTDIY